MVFFVHTLLLKFYNLKKIKNTTKVFKSALDGSQTLRISGDNVFGD